MKKILIFVFMFIPLCGCINSSPIVYTGESKNWSASFTIENPQGEYHNETLKIIYKGENPKEVSDIKYKYDGTNIGGSGEQKLSGNSSIVSKSGGNGALPPKDSIINVTVEWNGNKEDLQLSTNGDDS